MTAKVIPNLITSFRILLVIPLVWLLAADRYGAVLVLFAVAGLSDAVDGHLARRFGWMSRLGAVLDPLADKLLMVSAYLTLGLIGALPVLLVGLVLVRDLVIVGGALAYHLLIGRVEMEPTLVSKANTALQVLLVLLVLFSRGIQPLPPVLLDGVMLAVAASTVASGVNYVWIWSRKARARRRESRG